MTSLRIPCPACGSELKLRDRTLLGRRGRCPNCRHAFVLEEPEPIDLEIADTPTTPATHHTTRIIPPGPAQAATTSQAKPAPSASDHSPHAPVAPAEFFGQQLPAANPSSGGDAVFPAFAPVETGVVSSLRARKKRRASASTWLVPVLLLLGLGGVGGGVYWFYGNELLGTAGRSGPSPAGTNSPQAGSTSTVDATSGSPRTGMPGTKAGVTAPGGIATPVGPHPAAKPLPAIGGTPITLKYIPAGTRLIIHLHPARLWKEGSTGEELRFCLGEELGKFLGDQLQKHCLRPPQDVESATLCFIPGLRGSPPGLAINARFVQPVKKSELLDQLGEVTTAFGDPVFLKRGRASLLHPDLRGIASAPDDLAQELVQAVSPLPAAASLEELLALTDDARELTVVAETSWLRVDREMLFPKSALPAVDRCLDGLGDDAEAFLWTLNQTEAASQFELIVRNKNSVRPKQLEATLTQRFTELPHSLVTLALAMNPRQQGRRQIIGRFPAMMQVYSMATQTAVGPRYVRFATELPERAAPNLLIGTLLTWDESTRTDFSKSSPRSTPGGKDTALPATIAERLKIKVLVEFERTPLFEAFDYLGNEIKVPVEIDGDALKIAAYTKNMPQFLKGENMPVGDAIAAILKKYEKMCVVLDEQRKVIIVTSYAAAEAKRLTPYKFP